MGYSHSWYRVETPTGPLPPEPPDADGRLAFDALAIIRTATAARIEVADGTGDPATAPVVDDGGIWRNAPEPTTLRRSPGPPNPVRSHGGSQPGGRWWEVCTTNREPYDAVVCALLIRAAHRYGPSIRISSDGAWDDTVHDGRRRPEWTAGRRLVVALFGTDISPLT